MTHTMEKIWKALGEVKDPEIPVLSLVDLKVIRDVRMERDCVVVSLTPTFSGCPAMEQMKRDVLDSLHAGGFAEARVETVLSPPWSTDALSRETKEKLSGFGIAPPPQKSGELAVVLQLPVSCPFCSSKNTEMQSPFGATLCKQMFYCNDCQQPFERFKPL